MKTTLWFFVLALMVLAGCGKKEASKSPPATNATSDSGSGNPLTAPVEYLGALGKAKKLAEKTVDTASVNQAIQLFQQQEERYPKDLNELVTSHFLRQLPEAPYGMKFTYNPQTGVFKVIKQ
jgi:predicted small lipoprotein YifL